MSRKKQNDDLSMEERLAQMDEDWGQTDGSKNEFEQLPAGDYNASIYDVELTQSSNGNPMVKLQHQILDPEFENRFCWHNIVLTPKSIKIAKQTFYQLGMDTEDFELADLEDHLEELRGKEVSFKLSYKPNADGDSWPRYRYKGQSSADNEKPATKKAKKSKKSKKKTKKSRR